MNARPACGCGKICARGVKHIANPPPNVYDRHMKNLDYLKYRLKYRYGRHLPLGAPVDIMLELSSRCDLACSFCYHSKENQKTLPFKRKLMAAETIEKIITQGAELGVSSIKLNNRGEATLNKRFAYAATLAASLAKGGTYIDRITNSNFNFQTERDDIFEGLAHQTKVKISYDSFDSSVAEGQRINANWERVTANVDKFYDWPDRKTDIVIQAVRTQANKDEPIAELAEARWPGVAVSIRDVVGGRMESDTDPDILVKTRAPKRAPCLQAYVRLVFDWQGNAGMCCPDLRNKIVLGNIHEKSMAELFNGALAKYWRDALKSGDAFKFDPCKNCSSFESYAGYRAPWGS